MKVSELSEADLASIKACFHFFDKYNRNCIMASDFANALRWLKLIPAEAQIEQILEAIASNTPIIRFDKFCAAAASLWYPSRSQLETELWDAFLQFDKMMIGSIPADEFKKILTKVGVEPIPEREADKVIRKFANKKTRLIEYAFLIRSWLK